MSPFIVFILIVMALGFAILVIDFRRWRRERAAALGRLSGHLGELGGDAKTGAQPRTEATDTLEAYVLTDERARFACGHDYATRFGHDFYGERMEVADDYAAKREKCGDCMLAEIKPVIIRCCNCGHVIMPGEPVAAYGDDGKFKKAWSTTLPDGKTVLGCMSWDCCPSGGFFAGHWSSKGFRPAFGEHLSLAAQVISTGKPVAVRVADGKAEVMVDEGGGVRAIAFNPSVTDQADRDDAQDHAAVADLENEGGTAKPNDGEDRK